MNTSREFSIRYASLEDAEALATLAESCFRDSVAWYNSASDMDTYCLSNFGVEIQSAELASPEKITLVVESSGLLVGYCQLHPLRHKDCVFGSRPLEINRIYVARSWHGAGLGYSLILAAFEEAAKLSCDVVWLAVWEQNSKAISFYSKLGFVEVGEQSFQLGKDIQRDIVMRLHTSSKAIDT